VGLIIALVMTGAQQASAANTWIQVDTGFNHTCAVRADHTLWCWGTNDDGQLGLGTRDEGQLSPAQVGTDSDWASVSAGFYATCALKVDGTRWCMGWNGHGQLGVGSFEDKSTPTHPVWESFTFRSVSVGDAFACGIHTDGRRVCWGSNYQFRIGMGTGPSATASPDPNASPMGDQPYPVGSPSDPSQWSSLSSAFSHSCGLADGGTRQCWGPGHYGVLGLGSEEDKALPSGDPAEGTWRSVTAGGSHSCGVKSYRAYCWGHGRAGQLGNGNLGDQWTPVPVQPLRFWLGVEAGDTHTCGLTAGRTRWCWGSNDRGQLGVGDTVGRSSPATLSGEQTWSQISPGLNYTCGITTTSYLYCWGANSFGQLGVADNADRSVPVRVEG